MRRALSVAVALAAVSCGSSHPTSIASTPTAPTPPTTPPSTSWSIGGRITAVDSGSPISGATLTPGWSLGPVTTDGSGAYQLGDTATPPSTPLPIAISGDGMLTHNVWFTWVTGSRTGVDADLIHNAPPFSLDFYQQLVRDTFDNDSGAPFGVLRWTAAPSFYVRTVDQNGATFDPSTVPDVVEAVRRAVPIFSGGRYNATIETGTDVRAGAAGWVNIDIQRTTTTGAPGTLVTCGTSFVGSNPGTITLYYDVCGGCGHKIPGDIVVHEVGHAMGFFHVSDKSSVMYPQVTESCPRTGMPSSAEQFHARIAYSRPRGNRDPDQDPTTFRTIGASEYDPHILVR
jgi:hypothetical protein